MSQSRILRVIVNVVSLPRSSLNASAVSLPTHDSHVQLNKSQVNSATPLLSASLLRPSTSNADNLPVFLTFPHIFLSLMFLATARGFKLLFAPTIYYPRFLFLDVFQLIVIILTSLCTLPANDDACATRLVYGIFFEYAAVCMCPPSATFHFLLLIPKRTSCTGIRLDPGDGGKRRPSSRDESIGCTRFILDSDERPERPPHPRVRWP
ncbi:hypothetical protein B0H19DRAFT_418233 [Mycena capillaripes]|nr:hypothetical protein B0H19DRAFT_418233 [Mycena capillaripes]